MPLKYKVDVLAALKEKGYNTNKIRTERACTTIGVPLIISM